MFSGELLDFPYQGALLTHTISRSRYSASYRGSSMKSSAAGSADQRCQTLDTLTVFIFAIVNHPEAPSMLPAVGFQSGLGLMKQGLVVIAESMDNWQDWNRKKDYPIPSRVPRFLSYPTGSSTPM